MLPPLLHPEDGAVWTFETLLPYYTTTWHHSPEDLDLKHHHHESLKTHITNSVTFSSA
jgi:hypothetical protein